MVLRWCAIVLVLLWVRPATAGSVCAGVAVDVPGEPSVGPVCVLPGVPVQCFEDPIVLPPAPTVVVWRCLPTTHAQRGSSGKSRQWRVGPSPGWPCSWMPHHPNGVSMP